MTAGCLQEISYSDFGERLLARVGRDRLPLSGGWDVTERCNLGCAHCYIRQPAHDRQRASRELTQAQMCRILDEVADEGCLFFLFTGGEPLLRPDLLDIYRHAKRRGLLLTLFTNATLMTPQFADGLAEWRPQRIEVTLYGATAQTYDRVTGVHGAYERCMRGIEMLLERGLPLALKSTLTRGNRHELREMKALAAGLGLEFRFDSMLIPRLDGDRGNLEERLAPEESVELDLSDPERKAEWQTVREMGAMDFRGGEQVYHCGAGEILFYIDAYGQLSVCGNARQPAYDLTRGSFREGWHDFLAAVRRRVRTRTTECETCTAGQFCIQCPGWSQLVHGNDESPVDFVCRVGRLRERAYNQSER